MKTVDLSFNGVGTGHATWLQVLRSNGPLLAMAKDPEERTCLGGWQVLAATMQELSKHFDPDGIDHEYWGLVAMKLDMIQKIVKANPNWYEIPRKDRRDRSEPRNSWLPPELLKAGGGA